jgi:hypothetical protein
MNSSLADLPDRIFEMLQVQGTRDQFRPDKKHRSAVDAQLPRERSIPFDDRL